MGLAKTFTHSIAREIGRNYGKAASNYLLGDKHSTPIRMVRGNDITQKRGRLYHNDFDRSIKKFEIKGAQATFNQVLNIHSQYFSLVEEANADGVIDLNEMSFLVREIPKGIKVLERAKSALIDLGKKDLADKTDEKIKGFQEFMISLDKSLKIEELPKTNFNPIAFLCFFLSFFGLDRLYFNPKNFWSILYGFMGISLIFCMFFLTSFEGIDKMLEEADSVILNIYLIIILFMPLWYGFLLNPIKNGGYWGYRARKKQQKVMNKLAKAIKSFIELNVASYKN